MSGLEKRGIRSAAVCHDVGSGPERIRLSEACHGEVIWTSLYWWNKKIRSRAWKRPILEALQLVRTGFVYGSTHVVERACRQFGADLIHTNTILTPEGGRAARALGLPHVWHVRELLGKGKPFELALEGRGLRDYLSAHASTLLANSRETANCLRAYAGEELPLTVVPNGIDLSRYEEAKPSRFEPVIVAMVGSLTSRWKKHRLFVEAAALTGLSSGVEFHLIGQGGDAEKKPDEYVQALRYRIGELGLSKIVCLSGHRLDPVEIMRGIDVLVHPSDGESFGRVAVEAMAAGKPVIGVQAGGISEIVQDGVTGLLARPDDPENLGLLIKRVVLDADLRARLGQAGRQRAFDKYSIEKCAEAVTKAYAEAMVRPVGRRD
ncbi:MAG: glycosyltransferase family 4 protein [Acidobacteria bacterium]|nr:glycosyltransferase family 4 protein [Acidobacteriota bacterium]